MKKINPIYNEVEELVQSSFINPKKIKEKDKHKSYLNMNKEILTKQKEHKIREREMKKKQEEQLKNNKNEPSIDYYDIYEDQLGRRYKIRKNVKFEMHVNNSFFDIYSREIVYKLFNYWTMKYVNYNFELKDNKIPNSKEGNIKVSLKDMEKKKFTICKNKY